MARNRISKVLDLKCTLEPAGEESSERADERAKDGENKCMQLKWIHVHRAVPVAKDPKDGLEAGGEVVGGDAEDGGPVALRHQPLLGLVVREGAQEVLVAKQHLRKENAENEGGGESTDESLPCLLRRKFDQRRLTEEETPHVGHDVVEDNDGDGEEEPNKAFEDVLDDQLRLGDDHQKSHVCPTEHDELL